MTGNDVLKNLSEYNIWANQTMLDVFSSLPEVPANAARLFSHALNAHSVTRPSAGHSRAPAGVIPATGLRHAERPQRLRDRHARPDRR